MQTIKTTYCWVLKEGIDFNNPMTVVLPMSNLERKEEMAVLTTGQVINIISKAFEAGLLYGKDLYCTQAHSESPLVVNENVSSPDLWQYMQGLRFESSNKHL